MEEWNSPGLGAKLTPLKAVTLEAVHNNYSKQQLLFSVSKY